MVSLVVGGCVVGGRSKGIKRFAVFYIEMYMGSKQFQQNHKR